jgi:putative Ca2+/H+ antiporter (TMEM165/GDT1 family)
MRRYALLSGTLFALQALVQLARVVLQWPVSVASVDVPIWVSVIAFLITASLSIWAFRLSPSTS